MRVLLLSMLPHLLLGQAVETAPTARPMAVTISDTDLLRPAKMGDRTRKLMKFHRKKKRANTEEEEDEKALDDYRDFEETGIKNRDPGGLKPVTYSPITTPLDIPRFPEVSTLSPEPGKMGKSSKGFKVGKNTPLYTWYRPEALRRKGYYFMHYPWNMLPKPYRLRPSFQFIYPQEYQNTVYNYPSLPYNSDPYGVYRHLVPCGSPGGYCGNQGSGCGGGGGTGGGGGCGDSEGFSGDNESDEEDEDGEKSGEAHINKQDPLDDLDLEDLEKLDKDKNVEEEDTTETETEDKKRRRKVIKH